MQCLTKKIGKKYSKLVEKKALWMKDYSGAQLSRVRKKDDGYYANAMSGKKYLQFSCDEDEDKE